MKAHRYTIRNVSHQIDRALRKKASDQGVSLNTLVVRALQAEAGLSTEPKEYDDLDDLFGTWVPDRAVDRALAKQRQVDLSDWT